MTIQDIARAVGVSPSTVSLALNGKGGVATETRNRVLAVAESLGYSKTKKNIASVLFLQCVKTGKTINADHSSFLLYYIEGMTKAAEQYQLTLNIAHIQIEQMDQLVRTVQQSSADGYILLGTELNREDVEHLSKVIRKPLVFIDVLYPLCEASFINMDNSDIVFRMIDYLYTGGHRNFGIISDNLYVNNLIARGENYRLALKQRGIEPHTELFVEPTIRGARQSMLAFLEERPQLPSVFCCANDAIAVGALQALEDYKFHVPADVALVGFDSLPMSRHTRPPLTSVKVSNREMGFHAVERLYAQMGRQGASIGLAYVKMEFSCTLVIRASA